MSATPVRKMTLSLFAATLLMGACGGGVSVEEWATEVCNGLKGFVSEVGQVQTDIQSAVSPETTPEEGKQLLTDSFNSMIESTDTLIGTVEDAGVPDVEGGEDVQDQLLTGLNDMKSALEDAQPQIEALPDDPQTFQSEAEAIGTDLQAEMQGINDTLGAVSAPELEEQTRDVEACQSIGP